MSKSPLTPYAREARDHARARLAGLTARRDPDDPAIGQARRDLAAARALAHLDAAAAELRAVIEPGPADTAEADR